MERGVHAASMQDVSRAQNSSETSRISTVKRTKVRAPTISRRDFITQSSVAVTKEGYAGWWIANWNQPWRGCSKTRRDGDETPLGLIIFWTMTQGNRAAPTFGWGMESGWDAERGSATRSAAP